MVLTPRLPNLWSGLLFTRATVPERARRACDPVAYGLNCCRTVTDAGGITVWLAVIGVASVLQVLLLIGAGVAAAVVYRRASRALELVRVQTLNPAIQRLNIVLDDLHDVAGRVQAVDEQVRGAMSRTAGTVGHAATVMGTKFWPVLGVMKSIRTALSRRTA